MKKLNLNAIRIDGGTQPRERIDMDAVGDYAEAVKVGIEFPPVVVFHDGAEFWLADGFHRFHAHKQAGKASILADIRTGTLDDAKLFASGANGTHGLRRTNEDKRRAVAMALAVKVCEEWSDNKVAQHCGVSVPFVSAIRRPEVAAKQQEHRVASAEKKARDRNPITAAPAAPKSEKVATVATPAPAPEPEPEYFGPSEEELAAQEREEREELESLRKMAEADDQMAALAAENKQLRALKNVLESRIEGLMNEKNEAIRAAKSWQRKFEKAERAAKESA